MRDIEQIRKLVGNVTAEDLRFVDCAVEDNLGIFVPSTGFCQYAIRPNHTHPTYMFNIFISETQAIVKLNISIRENEYPACVLSPEIPHVEESNGEFKRYYAIMIDQSYFEDIYHNYDSGCIPEYLWHQFAVPSDLLFYLKEFMVEYQRNLDHQQRLLHSLAEIITHILIRSLLHRIHHQESELKSFGIEKAVQFMEQNFSRHLTVGDISESANMSQSHFDRKFQKEYGCSPKQYLNRLRIEKAKIYLQLNEESMTNIAFKCGFSNASHFSYYFRKVTGKTPSSYQESFRLPHS